MIGYQRGFSVEDALIEYLGGMIGGIIAIAIITALIILVTAVVLICIEIAQLHLRLLRSAGARWLILADLGLLLVGVLGAVLAVAGLPAASIYLMAWTFLLYVVTVEILKQHYREREADVESLDSYLGDFTPAAPATNGHLPSGVH